VPIHLKRALLRVSKWAGLFYMVRIVLKDGLRILCYHGIALEDENAFRASLFVSPQTLRKRLSILARYQVPVLDLETALTLQNEGKLPRGATVITFDDGFYGVYRHGLPLLEEFSFPATVYIATQYTLEHAPVFRLAVQYMFWKTSKRSLDPEGLGLSRIGVASLLNETEKEQISSDIEDFGEFHCNKEQRAALAQELAKRLDVDYSKICASRVLTLMNPEEIRAMAAAGVNIQLHTHHHRFPEDESAARELAENRAVLEPVVGKALSHFCYPSGIWSKKHWPWLESAGISSATTCEPGLNFRDTPRLALKRFLDRDDLSDIEFEAEISGFAELLRWIRRASGNLSRSHSRPADPLKAAC